VYQASFFWDGGKSSHFIPILIPEKASGDFNLNFMIIIKNAHQLSDILLSKKKQLKQIGFVPTMGALHAGHLALLKKCRQQNDISVFSIFVNPTQFNDVEDYNKYPVTLETDILLLEEAGCDILFLPTIEEIYPSGINNLSHYDLGFLETILEGKFRPGHFQGVCQVVHRLLQIVLPHTLFIGQKDFQQCMVIKKLLHITGLDKEIKIEVVETMRENDGLAMSSRNKRLPEEARKNASVIAKSLQLIKATLKPGITLPIIQKSISYLEDAGLKIDYIELANAETLEKIENWNGKEKAIVLAAAFIGNVRLIDNALIN
jgi:pantoate--beta-alanine ligase